MIDNWKVLLIDDDPGIRKVLALALQAADYTVVTAADGESGIKLCQTESPQIVITDIGMPGIDGLEVLRRIKELDPDKEVIVSTGFTEIALAVKAMQLDATGFVTKPVNDETLTQALQRAKERYEKRKDLKNYTKILEEKWMDTMEELARTFLFQKTLIESSIDGLVACDKELNLFIFNESMEIMLGYDKVSVIGKMKLTQLYASEEFEKFISRLASIESEGRQRMFPFRTHLVGVTGERVPVLLSATLVLQGNQRIGLVIHCRDLRTGGSVSGSAASDRQ
ncbi:MAG: response regulator [Desulforhabdus sp.]|jgi:PAS domain S-box-containing protein|nr:response regulator [Desulforhabdus sp.]